MSPDVVERCAVALRNTTPVISGTTGRAGILYTVNEVLLIRRIPLA
jgi:hypothetical protein